MMREFTESDLIVPAAWMDTNPEVPEGQWYKCFDGLIACGQGELVKTFLLPSQSSVGDELD
ncbi:MAG: hypothetical protein CMO80_19245 [Verrucomicrobiales bacterium]|nr:hypothetical protein [Verrucomicrobiales bacterium]|tara:strand:+ start:6978 stop:7160 length:183 start_codon:yes stop_codon:yes gene_type:complete